MWLATVRPRFPERRVGLARESTGVGDGGVDRAKSVLDLGESRLTASASVSSARTNSPSVSAATFAAASRSRSSRW